MRNHKINQTPEERLAYASEDTFGAVENLTKTSEINSQKELSKLEEVNSTLQDIKTNTKPKDIQTIEIAGISVMTLKGDKGDKGEKGDRGEQGVQGIQGDKGEQGLMGIQGIQGERGEKGSKGDKGLKGDKGEDGKDGKDGKDGIDGSPDTPEEISAKLNSFFNHLDFRTLKNIPDFALSSDRNNGGGILPPNWRDSSGNIISAYVTDIQIDGGISQSYVNGKITLSATGGVSSVSNSDGTLTISPTTGAVVASLNLNNENTWIGQQTFDTSSPIFSTMTAGSVLFAGTAGLLSQDNSYFKYDSTLHRIVLGSGTTTFPSSGTGSGLVTTSAAGNTFYAFLQAQNTSSGTTASTDIIIGNDSATDTTNFLDIGISSSNNADPLYTGLGAGGGYIFNASGELSLATGNASSIKFLTGGFLTANIRGSINAVGTWSISPASLTGTQATNALAITQTWNTSGAPTALLMNITDTASATGSLLFSFQVGSAAKLSLTKTGLLRFGATGTIGAQNDSGFSQIYSGTNILTAGNGDLMFSPRQGYGIGFSTSISGAGVLRGGMLNDGSLSFGASTFSTGSTTESRFTLNGAVTGNATATTATVGMRNSLTITPNAATPLIIGYQQINTLVASANNQTFVGIDLSSTFTPGAFTGLSSIRMRIGAGSTTTVPVQFTSGSLATTALVGGMEFLTDKWYGTITTGTARKEFTMNDIALTSGQVPYATTNGRLTSNSSMTTDGSGALTITGAFAAGSYTDFSNTKSGTDNGITASITNQLSSTTVTVTALSATATQAGIVDTSAQTYGGRKTFDDGITIGAGATATLRLKGYTVAGLPAGVAGEEAYVTDALAPVIGNNVAGGGAAYAKVWYNNANWTVTGI